MALLVPKPSVAALSKVAKPNGDCITLCFCASQKNNNNLSQSFLRNPLPNSFSMHDVGIGFLTRLYLKLCKFDAPQVVLQPLLGRKTADDDNDTKYQGRHILTLQNYYYVAYILQYGKREENEISIQLFFPTVSPIADLKQPGHTKPNTTDC